MVLCRPAATLVAPVPVAVCCEAGSPLAQGVAAPPHLSCLPMLKRGLSCLQVVFDQYREGDVVWVQDYHLMLLPALLKQRYPRMKVMPHKRTPLSVSVHRDASRT